MDQLNVLMGFKVVLVDDRAFDQVAPQLCRGSETAVFRNAAANEQIAQASKTPSLVSRQTMSFAKHSQPATYCCTSKLQLLAANGWYAIISTIRPDIDGDDICNKYGRQKYIDLKRNPLQPLHLNCCHKIQSVGFDLLRAERPELLPHALTEFCRAAG